MWGNAYYTAALCTTTAQANCANPCPWKGTVYDASVKACRADAATSNPAGVKTFFIKGVAYYEPQRCPYGGTYDAAANACVLVDLPKGVEAFVWESGLYYKPPSKAQCPYGGFLRHGELLPAGDPRRGAAVRRGKPHPDAGDVRPRDGLAEPAASGRRGHGGKRLRAVRQEGEGSRQSTGAALVMGRPFACCQKGRFGALQARSRWRTSEVSVRQTVSGKSFIAIDKKRKKAYQLDDRD